MQDRGLHESPVLNSEATMDFECPVRNALLKREFTRLRRAVSRVEYSVRFIDGNCVADFFSVETADDRAIEAVVGWRSIFVHLVNLKSKKVQVPHPS
jgi:hypothetical protein